MFLVPYNQAVSGTSGHLFLKASWTTLPLTARAPNYTSTNVLSQFNLPKSTHYVHSVRIAYKLPIQPPTAVRTGMQTVEKG